MLKKIVSTMTVTFLITSIISFIGATTAHALPTISVIKYYSGGSETSLAGFSSGTTSYSVTLQNPTVAITSLSWSGGGSPVHTCNGTVITSASNCSLNSGANTYSITLPEAPTNTYTITFTYAPPAAHVLTSTSTIVAGQVNPTIVIESSVNFACTTVSCYTFNLGTTGLTVGTMTRSGSTLTIPFTGTANAGTVTFQIPASPGGVGRPASNILSFVVGPGSSSSSSSSSAPTLSAAEIAAAAAAALRAAEIAAAEVRAAAIATAQSALSTVLKADKAGTLSEYRSANINITTTAGLTRLNAEVLKLTGADRTDFAKIKALADKIEFDEAFFNATARPSLAAYSTYGVTGVTDRILAVVNTKILELPADKRLDTKAMQDLVKVESFVDLVANPTTRVAVSSARLIEKGVLPTDTPYKHSVRSGLASYPEGSLNTMAKIEAAVKAELEKAGARKAKTAEIRARIAARNK
jgi:hypothetical protein